MKTILIAFIVGITHSTLMAQEANTIEQNKEGSTSKNNYKQIIISTVPAISIFSQAVVNPGPIPGLILAPAHLQTTNLAGTGHYPMIKSSSAIQLIKPMVKPTAIASSKLVATTVLKSTVAKKAE